MLTRSRLSRFLWLSIALLLLSCAGARRALKPIDTLKISVGDQDVVATNGMVASAHPVASEIGVEMLRRGGNAVDAAVATAFMLGVVEPNASGIGGGGFMLIKMVDSDEAVVIDYREVASASVDPDYYYENIDDFDINTSIGYRAVCVPGMVAGLCLAQEKFGTLPLQEVIEPAIQMAETGVLVNPKLYEMILSHLDVILSNPLTSSTYLHDGLPVEEGTKIVRTDLADTYRKIAAEGAKAFYRGQIAEKIAEDMAAHDGWISLSDLRDYTPVLREPVCGSYRGLDILSIPPPSSGGTHVIQLLNIVEGFDLRKLGHNTPDYIHIMCEAMKQVYADRAHYIADPAFADIPLETILSKENAKAVRRHIDPERARFDYLPTEVAGRESGNTSHMSIIDPAGNAVALTQTINDFFGCGVTVPEVGILLNDEMADFSDDPTSPNAIAPGKRPQSSMSPTILLKDGKPIAVLGTPGGSRIISALAQIIINIVDFEMGIDEAIEAPRFHCEGQKIFVEGRIDSTVVAELERRGHTVEVKSDYDVYFGGAQGILIDQANGRILGGADSRRNGMAAGF